MDFDKIVIRKSFSIPVLVEFASAGCGPCLWVERQLVEITKAQPNEWHFVSLNVEDFPGLTERFHIRANPTIILFMKGSETGRLRGALPRMAVEQWIDDHLTT